MISNIATFVFFQFFMCTQCYYTMNVSLHSILEVYVTLLRLQYILRRARKTKAFFSRQFYFNYKPMYL